MGIDLEYGGNKPLEDLLGSIDHPGDFCTHRRLFAPMPRLEVEGVGVLSFPVPLAQVRALLAVAERAPYGKGQDTLVDTSVRDCWQIDAVRIRLAGGAWPDTFAGIVAAAAQGLGCAPERLEARLYKLLIYEQGGFFAPHRDTEKADGMIATLTIALPTAGVGGELVVRHRQREAVIETHVEEPSELAFAAFYADCTHETRPVRAGHRLSLVFNLCVSGDDDLTPRHAPDYADHVDRIAAHLARWGSDETASNKLVWLLDHDYSEAGLSFRALKNGDANLARTLIQSAAQAECELFAAIVHIRDHGDATYHGSYVDSYGNWREEDADDMEFNEIFDSQRWLDRWTAPDGRQPPFDEAPLLPGELLPAGALDGAPPDKQWLHEASGNEGVTLERAYRRAAFVIWPRSKTLEVLADAGINNAVDWVAEALAANDGVPNEKIDQFCRRLIHVWPGNRYAYGYRNAPDHVRMLDLLEKNGREAPVRRFLHDVVLGDYRGTEDHQAIMGVSHLIPPDAVGKFLAELTQTHFAEKSEEVLALLRLALERYQPAGDIWREPLQDCVRSALAAFGTKLRDAESDDFYYRSYGDYDRRVFGAAAIRDLFLLAWRCGSPARGTSAEDSLTSEAEQAARLVANRPAVVEPQRELAEALPALYQEDGLPDAPAYGVLWRHATERLLARSETPPVAPRDWRIKTNTGCDCAHCADLRAFCRDPDATATRFSMREDLRSHLESEIRRAVLDIDTKTEKKGRPYTLVCTKNRASYRRRLAEYAEDVDRMDGLAQAVAGSASAAETARLRQAVAAGRAPRVGS